MEKEKNRKNWVWVFFIAFAFILLGVFKKLDVLCHASLVALAAALLYIQLSRGYALNGQWTESISKKEQPGLYWFMIGFNIIMLLLFIMAPLIQQKLKVFS